MADYDVRDELMENAPSPQTQHKEDQDAGTDDDEDESEESDDEPVEVLAVTRERRANAGNRMSKLLELAKQEDAQQEEEYEEIFQETADDVEFEAADDEEGDVNMESSSEDEDTEGAQDEEAGENELKREERQKTKKRKRESLLQDAMKRAAARVGPKNVPAQPAITSSPTTEAPLIRPRKKSERVSWLPEAAEGALRASSRQLAVQNKTAVHERLKEKEKHRLKTVAIMRAAERRKDAERPKAMTQEQRLEEAARIERINSKSLNRWETAEKQRQEEQKARLAALKNHRLEGPIISYYSGPALWVNDRLKVVGKGALVQEVKDRPSTAGSQEKMDDDSPALAVRPLSSHSSKGPDQPMDFASGPSPSPSISAAVHSHPSIDPSQSKQERPLGDFLQGIEEYANSNPQPLRQDQAPLTQSPAPGSQSASTFATPSQPAIVSYETPYSTPTSHTSVPTSAQHAGDSLLAQFQNTFSVAAQPAPAPASQPKLPPRRELASRILITLQDFPQENISSFKKEPDFIRHHLLGWPLVISTSKKEKPLPPPKKSICAVTGQPARYCDPATGLYYIDAVALKGMRWVVNSKGRWSELTGTFAHPMDKMAKGRPARGVPDLFLMDREGLAKRKEEWNRVREEQERVRAEARAKAQAQGSSSATATAGVQPMYQAQKVYVPFHATPPTSVQHTQSAAPS
jgi:vacuolar protein sorting-associated protein 72